MRKKDWEEVAKVLRETEATAETCTRLAEVFAERYPRFNKERFLIACVTA